MLVASTTLRAPWGVGSKILVCAPRARSGLLTMLRLACHAGHSCAVPCDAIMACGACHRHLSSLTP